MSGSRLKQIGILLLLGILFSMYQVIFNYRLLIVFIIGIVLLVVTSRLNQAAKGLKTIGVLLGIILMSVAVLSTMGIWFSLAGIAIVLFFFSSKVTNYVKTREHFFWNEKRYYGVTTVEPDSEYRRVKTTWFENQRIGENVYAWDDINLQVIAGDTIIDLGNTILPKEENVVVIRKGFGRIRLLVPMGIGVSLHHSTFAGQVCFEQQELSLKNESIQLRSKGYNEATKKIRVHTSVVFGSIEVIEV